MCLLMSLASIKKPSDSEGFFLGFGGGSVMLASVVSDWPAALPPDFIHAAQVRKATVAWVARAVSQALWAWLFAVCAAGSSHRGRNVLCLPAHSRACPDRTGHPARVGRRHPDHGGSPIRCCLSTSFQSFVDAFPACQRSISSRSLLSLCT